MSSVLPPTHVTQPGPVEYALLAAVSLTWGTSYMFTKVALGALGPFTLIAFRTSIAMVVTLLITAVWRSLRLTWRDFGAFAIVGFASNAAPLCLIALSVSYVNSSVTATTMAMVPLITALLGAVRGEHSSRRDYVGIAVGFAGIIVLFGPGTLLAFGDNARGALAAVSAATVFSSSLFLMRLVRRHDPMVVTAGTLTSAALWTTPIALLLEGVPRALPGGAALGAVIMLAVVNTAAASMFLFALVPRAGTTFTSYNNYLVPVVAVFCGSIFLGEPVTVRSIAGVALILGGVAIATVKPRSSPAPAEPALTENEQV